MFYFLNNLIIFVRCKVTPIFFKLYLQGCCRIKNVFDSREQNRIYSSYAEARKGACK